MVVRKVDVVERKLSKEKACSCIRRLARHVIALPTHQDHWYHVSAIDTDMQVWGARARSKVMTRGQYRRVNM